MTTIIDSGVSLASPPCNCGWSALQLPVIIACPALYDQLTSDCPVNGPSRLDATNFISQALFTGPTPPSSIRPVSCETDPIPAVFGSNDALLDFESSARLFTPDQQRVIIALGRDGAAQIARFHRHGAMPTMSNTGKTAASPPLPTPSYCTLIITTLSRQVCGR